MIEFDIGGPIGGGEALAPFHRRLTAFCEAIDWHLVQERTLAPFRKIHIQLRHNDIAFEPGVYLAPPIVHVKSKSAPSDLAGLVSQDLRKALGAVAEEALDAIHQELDWRDQRLDAAIRDVAEHAGPYLLRLPRAVVRNRTTRVTYVTYHEISEEASRIVVECQAPDSGRTSRTVVLTNDRPSPMVFFFNPSKVKVVGNEIVYLSREGLELARTTLPRCT